MSRQQIHWNTREADNIHKQKLLAKVQKIEGLKALLEMHEANPDHDHDYVLGLRARLRSAQNQLAAMSL